MNAPVRVRPLDPSDAPALRALAEGEFARTSLEEVAQAAVREALAGSDEYRALVAESDEGVLGVVIFGPVAGSVGTARLHIIVVTAAARLRGVARMLCDRAVRTLADEGARLVVAEMADTPALRAGRVLLERCGWREEGRVDDLFADGVALVLLRRDT